MDNIGDTIFITIGTQVRAESHGLIFIAGKPALSYGIPAVFISSLDSISVRAVLPSARAFLNISAVVIYLPPHSGSTRPRVPAHWRRAAPSSKRGPRFPGNTCAGAGVPFQKQVFQSLRHRRAALPPPVFYIYCGFLPVFPQAMVHPSSQPACHIQKLRVVTERVILSTTMLPTFRMRPVSP